MLTEELDYPLPERLIAQHPAERRDDARLLVVERRTGELCEDVFRNLGDYLRPPDCLILNDTRVIRARLTAEKLTGGKIEVFLLREIAPGEWEALVRPSNRMKPGSVVRIGPTIQARIDEVLAGGARRVRFSVPDVIGALEAVGEIPLPPYIRRAQPDASDAERYQTVFARRPGAVAAPTAGLHFTPELLAELDRAGVRRAHLTLHVGYGTFKPIQTARLEEHQVDAEDFDLPDETAATLDATRAAGGRVVAVGTTTARVLETQWRDGAYRAGSGVTRLFLHPPHTFRGVDALITNFHLPKSSLLALVCAFAGTELTFAAYRHAVAKEFRFYSYGDAMLIV
jgi:S-adenosylmethionine:tRNA ribosyltransferase-isomerase